MYKKLLNFKKRSTDEIPAKDTGHYKPLPVQPDTNCDCHCCCNSNKVCYRDVTCSQALCQLCTASLILPSCVGAIRALQSSFVQHVDHNCCTSGSQWLPATNSATLSKLHGIAHTHCCAYCC